MANAFSLSGASSNRWLLVGWFTAFLVGTDLFIVAPFLPSIGAELGVDPASLTILVSAFSLTYAVAGPLQGRVAERVGLRDVLCFGVVALGVANLYTAAAPDLFHLTASRVLAGLAAASITPMLYALTAARAAPAARAGTLALVNSGLVLALAAGAPIGLAIGTFSGWRTVFAMLGGTFLLLLPIHLATWQRAEAAAAARSANARGEQLRDGAILFLAMALWSISIYASYTLLPTAMNAEMRWPVPLIASALACFGAGATVGAVLGGRLADHVGPPRFVRVSFLATGAAFVAASLIHQQNSVWALSAALFLIALVAYGFFPALQACAAAVFAARRPTVLGIMSSSLYLGTALGAAGGAKLFLHGGMSLVLIASAVVAFAGFAATRSLRMPPALPVS